MVLWLHPRLARAFSFARVARGTSVLIVADARLYRDGLARSLGRRSGIRVVGAPIGPENVIGKARAIAPDVVVFDVTDGLSCLTALFQTAPSMKVIALGLEAEADVIAYAEAGVSGFVGRDSSLDELVTCIRSVAHDKFVCSPRVAAILLQGAKQTSTNGGAPELTSRQLEILQLIDAGLSNKEIAQRLCIEVSTVKNHVHQILERLDVRSRREAAAVLRSSNHHPSLTLALLAAEVLNYSAVLDLALV